MFRKVCFALFLLYCVSHVSAETSYPAIDFYLEGVEEAPSADLIDSILKGNVFDYFGLNDEYETPLKQKNFKSGNEYKGLADSLAVVKKELLKKTFYVTQESDFQEYSLKTGRLKASSMNSDFAPYTFFDPRVVEGYLFEKLPYDKEHLLDVNWYSRIFPMTAKEAEYLEEEACDVYIIFKVSGTKKVQFDTPRVYVQHDGPYADKFKVVITHRNGSEVFFVKDFTSTKANK